MGTISNGVGSNFCQSMRVALPNALLFRFSLLITERSLHMSTLNVIDLCSDDEGKTVLNTPKSKKRSGSPVSPSSAVRKKVTNPYLKSTSSPEIRGGNNDIIRFATWNVWFGPEGDGTPLPAVRMRALCDILRTQDNLLCVGFQEVIDPLQQHLQSSLERSGYTFFRQPDSVYGCALAVNNRLCNVLDMFWRPYADTKMARGIAFARISYNGKQLLFITTHLESYVGAQANGSRERVLQLQELELFCQEQFAEHSALEAAIITGDLNWDDERKRGKGQDPILLETLSNKAWKDCWKELRKDEGYSYDGKLNPMLSNQLRRRFDRILLRSKTIQPVGAQLVGTEAIGDLTWTKRNPFNQSTREMPVSPSDHFGLVVEMRLT